MPRRPASRVRLFHFLRPEHSSPCSPSMPSSAAACCVPCPSAPLSSVSGAGGTGATCGQRATQRDRLHAFALHGPLSIGRLWFCGRGLRACCDLRPKHDHRGPPRVIETPASRKRAGRNRRPGALQPPTAPCDQFQRNPVAPLRTYSSASHPGSAMLFVVQRSASHDPTRGALVPLPAATSVPSLGYLLLLSWRSRRRTVCVAEC